MDDHDALIERLQHLGRQPVEPAVQSAHLRAMATPARPALRSKLRIAGAFLAGLLVGGSGLAVAGALPDPAQNVAHNVLAEVGVQVPQPERYHDDAACGGARGDRRNHGDYVRGDKSLARTDCGKPRKGGAGGPTDKSRGPRAEGEGPKAAGERDACQGPPPWAGTGMSPEDKAAAQAERAARCGADDADESTEERTEPEVDGQEAEEPSGAEPAPSTTTTTPPTTSTAPSTTAPADPSTTTTAG